jgi:hypothetical protein
VPGFFLLVGAARGESTETHANASA